VLVDNSDLKQAPVVIETSPTYRNLFGTIDRVVDRYGRVVTNFTRIKSGSLLQANGGYLVINLEDALTEPFVWKELKRVLTSGHAEIEVYDPFSMFTIAALKPEPVPLDVKVIAVGSPLLYHLLYRYDDDFREIFKVKAEFDTEILRSEADPRMFGQLVRKLSDTEGLPAFDAQAVAELVCAASRMAADQRRVTSEFCRIVDLVREAGYWSRRDGAPLVSASHVRQALREQIDRSDLVADKIRELIAEGTLLISLGEPAVGQANGLTVADLGDYQFGWPVRVTASMGVGTAGLINIEREARLSGRTYDKGMLILEGYLRNQYARDQPLALTASLAMEQSYGGVDGDSASLVETLCLLSAIAGIPLRQDVALTGSISQHGQVQAIGGANEKIEGFFDVCREHGLSGRQGVCLPKANVHTLVLRHDVVEAVGAGQFHLWPVEHIDQAIELLTERAAGTTAEPESFHGRVQQALKAMGQALRARRGGGGGDHGSTTITTPPAPPTDPRPPLPGRSEEGDSVCG
ncbi:MAG: ATP-dependent protease, partial [Planctomycetaceae bacterium]